MVNIKSVKSTPKIPPTTTSNTECTSESTLLWAVIKAIRYANIMHIDFSVISAIAVDIENAMHYDHLAFHLLMEFPHQIQLLLWQQ